MKALCLAYPLETAEIDTILLACSAVDKLAVWGQRIVYNPALNELRPHQLIVNLEHLFQSEPCNFGLGLFCRVTHLHLVEGILSWLRWPRLHQISDLTHLTLDLSNVGDAQLAWVSPVLADILRSCLSLKLCILYTHQSIVEQTKRGLQANRVLDPRVVVMPYANPMEYWATCVRGDVVSQWSPTERTERTVRAQTGKVFSRAFHLQSITN